MTDRVELTRGSVTIRVVPDQVADFEKAGYVKAERKVAPKRRTTSRKKAGDA